MPKRPWLVEGDKPSYQILKFIDGGGFGQVFKVLRNGQVVACKQVQLENTEAALDEYDHMKSLRGAPHIATLHDGLELNRKTSTLSFFMDYYKGKDLDRQVHLLRGAAENFTETQVIEIGYQIAVALEFCHSHSILHQDLKPMNILLQESWNPLTQRDVPDLYVADFGIASRVQTIGTRLTRQRGTPGYEAPEIRGQGYQQAAFSQKSDVYAFGCILYRLCTLEDPFIVDDIKPCDISADYSVDLLSLISSMLSADRDERPTAEQIREQLASFALKLFQPAAPHCRTCHQTFPSKNQLRKHYYQCTHNAEAKAGLSHLAANGKAGLKIRGAADASAEYHYDENNTEDVTDPSPCVVCMRHFNSKRQFFGHLHGANHYRQPKYVLKRRADQDTDIDAERHEKRLARWIEKDMDRHD